MENSGFITREKSGRSKLIKLTPKFFEYFDIDPSKLKQKFTSAGDIEKAIEAKETEIEGAEVAQRKETAERLETPQIVLENGKKPLETYPVVQPVEEMLPTGVQVFMEKLGNLDVYDVPREAIPPSERPPLHKHRKKHVKPVEKPAEPAPEAPEVPILPAEVPTEVPVEKKKRKKAPVEEKPAEEKPAEPAEIIEVLSPEQRIVKEAEEKAAQLKPTEFEAGKGLFPEGIPPEVEAKIEERIKKIMTGKDEEEEKQE